MIGMEDYLTFISYCFRSWGGDKGCVGTSIYCWRVSGVYDTPIRCEDLCWPIVRRKYWGPNTSVSVCWKSLASTRRLRSRLIGICSAQVSPPSYGCLWPFSSCVVSLWTLQRGHDERHLSPAVDILRLHKPVTNCWWAEGDIISLASQWTEMVWNVQYLFRPLFPWDFGNGG